VGVDSGATIAEEGGAGARASRRTKCVLYGVQQRQGGSQMDWNQSSQPRLIRGCPEAIVISAHHVPGFGWSCKVSTRRQFELWPEARTSVYEQLSTEELVDVIQCEADLELLSE